LSSFHSRGVRLFALLWLIHWPAARRSSSLDAAAKRREFVNAADSVMVQPDDPTAFAEGIIQAMPQRCAFDAEGMRSR